MTASGTTVVVVNGTTCVSSPNPVISVLQDGKGVARARLDIYHKVENGEHPSGSETTDDDGVARLPQLSPGQYRVFVDAGKETGTIALTVSNDAIRTAVCELRFPPPVNVEQQRKDDLAALAREAPTVWLTDFRGVVEDPSLAVIPRAKIQLYRKGALDKGVISELQSDEKGQFSMRLENGAYIAIFAFPGFQTRAIAAEIGKAEWKGVRVPMSVGASPQPRNEPPKEWKLD